MNVISSSLCPPGSLTGLPGPWAQEITATCHGGALGKEQKNGPDAAPPRAQIREKRLFPNADGFHTKTVHTEAVNGRSRKAPWSGETEFLMAKHPGSVWEPKQETRWGGWSLWGYKQDGTKEIASVLQDTSLLLTKSGKKVWAGIARGINSLKILVVSTAYYYSRTKDPSSLFFFSLLFSLGQWFE